MARVSRWPGAVPRRWWFATLLVAAATAVALIWPPQWTGWPSQAIEVLVLPGYVAFALLLGGVHGGGPIWAGVLVNCIGSGLVWGTLLWLAIELVMTVRALRPSNPAG